ncbi:cyclin-J isoform X2 [Agrilus planipennis]|uniref:Cyclin-J isoform X2 n=1 Tax=Agrilus planipennis TaxID=224129 RepID=A0A1W4WWM9_AGRPL|nr:cyclin-J isoform X2 [Agrilus planipennis]
MDFAAQELASKDSTFWNNADLWRQFIQYEEDFKKVIKQREMQRIPFHHQSPQILFRNELIAYLKQTATQKKMSHSCLHLAVYLLDIFMDNHDIVPHYLQLVCNVCLLIAAKFEECAQKIPKIADMNALVKNRYSRQEYKSVEILILNFFFGYIMFPTAAHYTYYYMQALISPEDMQYFSGNSRELLFELNESIKIYLECTIDGRYSFYAIVPPFPVGSFNPECCQDQSGTTLLDSCFRKLNRVQMGTVTA